MIRVQTIAVNVITVLSIFSLATSAHGQTDGPGSKLEEVVVTGSLIKRGTDVPISSPVETLSREDMGLTPRATISDFIIESPINSGSFNSQEQTSASDSSAIGFNLRGLGPRNTLVLINGQRQVASPHPDKQNFNKVDVNALMPSIMVDRIEILKDGAASLYGSDAIAGVANFITRDNFEGFEMSVDWMKTENGGKDDLSLQGLWGAQGERSGVVAAFEYQNRDPLFIDDMFSPERFEEFGSLSSFSTPASFRLGGTPGGAEVPDPLCGDPSIDAAADAISLADINRPVSVLDGTRCRKPFAVGRGFNAEEFRINSMVRAFYDVNENLSTHLEVGFNRTELERFNQTLPTAFPFASPSNAVVPASHPGNPFGQDVLYTFGRLGVNGQPFRAIGAERGLGVESSLFRVNSGFEANLFDDKVDVDFDITYAFADENVDDADVHEANLGLALRGLGGINCNPATGTPGQGDCLYFNPFANAFLAEPGDPQFNTPEAWEFVQPAGSIIKDGFQDLMTINLVFSGELFDLAGGPAAAAVGFQYRDESWSMDKSFLSNSGALVFEGVNPDAEGGRDAYAVFGEIVAPVWEGVELSFSGRFEDFGGGTDSFDPKFGIVYEPVENLLLRGTYSTAFQVAGLNELNSTIVEVNSLVFQNTVSSVLTTVVGDPNVAPQESENLSLGLEYSWQNFDLTVDYWNIEFTDIIGTRDPQTFFDLNRNDPNLVRTDAQGNPLAMTLLVQNLSAIEADGIDFSLDWGRDFGEWGEIEINTTTSYVNEYKIQQLPGDPFVKGAGFRQPDSNFAAPMPKWRGSYRLKWMFGPNRAYQASIRSRFVSNIDDRTRPETPSESFTPIDLTFSASAKDLLGFTGRDTDTSILFGINNVFDEQPPGIINSNLTFDPRTYNGVGRQFVLSFSHTFK